MFTWLQRPIDISTSMSIDQRINPGVQTLHTDFLHLFVGWPLVDRPLIDDLRDIFEPNGFHSSLASQCNVHRATKLLASEGS
jgi:hypothetical protein